MRGPEGPSGPAGPAVCFIMESCLVCYALNRDSLEYVELLDLQGQQEKMAREVSLDYQEQKELLELEYKHTASNF